MSRKNGGIIGPANTPVGGLMKGVAGGVWRMNDVLDFVSNSQWPTGPQDIENSLRFNRASSDYLNRTPSSEGNKRTMTFSFWLKRSGFGQERYFIYSAGADASNRDAIATMDESMDVIFQRNDSTYYRLRTNRLFRDPSAWYNIVIAIDTTDSTASNRIKFYVNGVQESSFATSDYPTQNLDLYFNDDISQAIGSYSQSSANHYDGYMAEVVLIDGQQLDPTSFGEFDSTTGIWKPKKIGAQFGSGGAGTNGFYLDFKDSSNLGNDASGNNNDFTVNNLTSIDQSTDTCVVNYTTLNPLDVATSGTSTFSDGNLTFNTNKQSRTTFGASSGKWYCEAKYVNNVGFNGIAQMDGSNTNSTNSIILFGNNNGEIFVSGSTTDTNVGAGTAISDNSIIMFAMDLDNNRLYIGKNGSWWTDGSGFNSASLSSYKSITRVTGDSFGFKCSCGSGTGTTSWNFGNPPYSISSGNSDANGFGNFEYSVPSGYYALNTTNLNTYG